MRIAMYTFSFFKLNFSYCMQVITIVNGRKCTDTDVSDYQLLKIS